MKFDVVFPLYKPLKSLPDFKAAYMLLAENLVEGVREHMPQARIVQYTDPSMELAIESVDWIRSTQPMTTEPTRPLLELLETAPHPLLYIDVDSDIRDDVSDVWDFDFDVAVTPLYDVYVGGFCFCRTPEFWREVRAQYERDRHIQDGWAGAQIAFARAVRSRKFKALVLPNSVYQYTPRFRGDDCEGARIVHYRAKRKWWLQDRIRSRNDNDKTRTTLHACQ